MRMEELQLENMVELPEGWAWRTLQTCVVKIPLNGIKVKQKEYLEEGRYPVIDQGRETIGGFSNDETKLVQGEPPFVLFGDHSRVIKYATYRFVPGAEGLIVLKCKEFIDSKYLFFLLHAIEIPDKGYARHYQHLSQSQIPLPPLAEQQRIVAQIEALFSELEAGKARILAAQQQLKTYRQAVLKWAFEGRLTREDVVDGELPEGWEWVTFGDANEIMPNLVDPFLYLSSPHIAPDNISKGTGKLLEYRTIAEDEVKSAKHKFSKGQILYSKIRPNLAKVVISTFDGLCSADMYPIDSKGDIRYTFYYMLSESFVNQASNTETRTVLPKINQKGLNAIPFPLPPLEEQHRIVQEIESRLDQCDTLEAALQAALQDAEALRQSILKQAFEGKLHSPAAESASNSPLTVRHP